MARCRSCPSSKKVYVNTFNIDPRLGHTIYVVSFNANRLLISYVSGQKVQVHANYYVDVYENDLVHWITKYGVKGITFAHPEEEANFLTKNPSIRRERYV